MSTQRARWENSVVNWSSRAGVSASESNCPDTAALDVRKFDIGDGPGGKFAEVVRNFLDHPVYVVFDSAENWYNGTGSTPCTGGGATNYDDNYVDFWGIAVHEMGHIWGLDHTASKYTPYGTSASQWITMYGSANGISYVCPGKDKRLRNLTSDDDAGITWVAHDSQIGNYSFERAPSAEDCTASYACVEAWLWQTIGSFNFDCSQSHAGTCSIRSSSAPLFYQRIRNQPRNLANGLFDIRVLNPGLLPVEYKLVVKDVTNSSGVTISTNQTCVVDGLAIQNATNSGSAATSLQRLDPSLWSSCATIFSPISSAERIYQFEILSLTSGVESYFDSVHVSIPQ